MRTTPSKRREAGALWLMLLPVAALGAWAWKSRKPAEASGPSRVVVRSVEHEPLSARDVARGVDTRVKILVGYEGAPPRGWGDTNFEFGSPALALNVPSVEAVSNGKRKSLPDAHASEVGLGPIRKDYDEASGLYVESCTLRLRDVPLASRVEVAGSLIAPRLEMMRDRDRKPGQELRPPLRWRALVREAGQKTPPPPRVSRFCPLTLTSVSFERDQLSRSVRLNAEVICRLAPALADDKLALSKLRIANSDAFLEDAHGARWECAFVTYKQYASPEHFRHKSSPENTAPMFVFDPQSDRPWPKKLEGLTFRALIGVGDHWPLEVRVPVRNVQ